MQNDIVECLHAELAAALKDSAPLTWRQAPGLCYQNPDTAYTCTPYHRVWQYLGLLGVATSMRTDTAFMIGALRSLARNGAIRVLVSGTADYAMLAHVLWAYRLEGVDARVTVTDRCETPLASNRWYAQRHGVAIETVCGDILEFAGASDFDVICTHSFLGWFDPAMQARLLAQWRTLLRPGGHLITTKRLRSGSPDTPMRNTEDDAIDLQTRVYNAALRHADRHSEDPAAMAAAAYDFAREHCRYPTVSAEALRAQFEAAGLRVTHLDDGAPSGPHQDLSTGPARGRGNRVRIIARRDG